MYQKILLVWFYIVIINICCLIHIFDHYEQIYAEIIICISNTVTSIVILVCLYLFKKINLSILMSLINISLPNNILTTICGWYLIFYQSYIIRTDVMFIMSFTYFIINFSLYILYSIIAFSSLTYFMILLMKIIINFHQIF